MTQTGTIKKIYLPLFGLLFLMSCGKGGFINELQGTWKVTEINYFTSGDTVNYHPANMTFLFMGTTYTMMHGDTVGESGNFDVNPKVTQISFYSGAGNSVMLIQEKNETFQHWRTKHKIINMSLDFKLEKIQ